MKEEIILLLILNNYRQLKIIVKCFSMAQFKASVDFNKHTFIGMGLNHIAYMDSCMGSYTACSSSLGIKIV